MKEINAAYEQITKERSGRASGSSGSDGVHGSYGQGYGGYRATAGMGAPRATAVQSSVLQQVRIAINDRRS